MQNKKTLNFLLVGDIFATPGIELCERLIPQLKQEHDIDFVIVNGENAAKDGRGLLEKTCDMLFAAGADFITTGNHVWKYDKFYAYLEQNSDKVIRPANFPTITPGKGYALVDVKGHKVGIVNAMGRVFFKENLACPFRELESIIDYLKTQTKMILVDFHAEATSEKQALGFFLDGKISALWGTHTHVQTSDCRVMPGGTGYITDLGFCGAQNSCIGVKKETVVNQYLTQMPARFAPEIEGPFVFSGAVLKLDTDSGKAVSFESVYKVEN